MSFNKKVIVWIMLLIILAVVQGCKKDVTLSNSTQSTSKTISELEQKYVIEKAKNLTLGMYLNLSNYVKEQSDVSVHDKLLTNIENVKNVKIQDIKISSTEVKNSAAMLVIVEIYEHPFTTVKFYEMEFKKVNNEWILVNIGFDA